MTLSRLFRQPYHNIMHGRKRLVIQERYVNRPIGLQVLNDLVYKEDLVVVNICAQALLGALAH